MAVLIRNATQPVTGTSLTALLPPTTRLLGLGEPTHGVEVFPELRNELFRHLVEHEGYRSIAVESDCLAALVADAYVTDGTGTLDDAMSRGFSHGLGDSPANRELVRWLRAHNERRPPHERVRFYGFDGPVEMTGAASPRPALTALHDYLASHLDLAHSRETLDELLGPDEDWTNPAATTDPTRSVGRTPEAQELRLIADDLGVLLTAHAPHLTTAGSHDDWWRAGLRARAASGLLRYHAGMADTTPTRVGTLMCLRETMMADNLLALVDRESLRGPTLAYAHNRHLQKDRSRWLLPEGWGSLAGRTLEWWSAGSITAARLGDQYAFTATAFGTRGSDVPRPDSLEGLLSTLPDARTIVDPARLASALDREPAPRVPADHTYFPLDPATTDQTDAIIFVRDI
ncbi:erythromycin esterase family protein [Actinoalloteichus caeruleus]|uniref:erythromycin esterase family protein n=1 Tax=Actinoalloteichus cyanogriseus TaxID=2893586 RepID=UPI003BB96645